MLYSTKLQSSGLLKRLRTAVKRSGTFSEADRNDFLIIGDRCILTPPVLVASLTRGGFKSNSISQLVEKRKTLNVGEAN